MEMRKTNRLAGSVASSVPTKLWRISKLLTVCACAGVVGCTSLLLRHSTNSVSSSIRQILQKQVLDNLGRFVDNPYTIPSEAVLTTGAIQIQSQVTGQMKLPYTVTRTTDKEVDPGANVQWQESWTITPVMDSSDLSRLEYLYQGAVSNARQVTAVVTPSAKYFSFETHQGHVASAFISCKTPPPSPFEDCTAIDKLLANAPYWLASDAAPVQVGNANADGFVDEGNNGGHHIWVRPKGIFRIYDVRSVFDPGGKGCSRSLGRGICTSLKSLGMTAISGQVDLAIGAGV